MRLIMSVVLGEQVCGTAITLPTAASPSRTSLTLLLGFGADAAAESVMGEGEGGLFARKLAPTPYADSLDRACRTC